MASKKDFPTLITKAYHLLLLTFSLVIVGGIVLAIYVANPAAFHREPLIVSTGIGEEPNKIENGIHIRTGLVEAEGLMTVVNNCTYCHSAKIIIQNRMNTERWNATIKWMQETQNLGDLGANQEVIVNYLVTNYPPKMVGRRAILTDIDWYELKVNNNE